MRFQFNTATSSETLFALKQGYKEDLIKPSIVKVLKMDCLLLSDSAESKSPMSKLEFFLSVFYFFFKNSFTNANSKPKLLQQMKVYKNIFAAKVVLYLLEGSLWSCLCPVGLCLKDLAL